MLDTCSQSDHATPQESTASHQHAIEVVEPDTRQYLLCGKNANMFRSVKHVLPPTYIRCPMQFDCTLLSHNIFRKVGNDQCVGLIHAVVLGKQIYGESHHY